MPKPKRSYEGFVLVSVKEIKTWYLDDSEGIYREDPEWLCDIPVGEVVGKLNIEFHMNWIKTLFLLQSNGMKKIVMSDITKHSNQG